jgi:predicted RND superfamily exporter protein
VAAGFGLVLLTGLVIFAVLRLDFRSTFESLLALLPVVIGFSITFGIMWLAGMSINAANIIVLPLMFGLAVDAGVHMLHRYHQHPSSRPLGLSHGTGKGVAVTTLTTIVGFLTMVFASHRGIASLGFVLTIGLSLTLLACLTVMPAALEIRQRRRERKAKLSS